MRQLKRRTNQINTEPAAQDAPTRAELETKIGFGSRILRTVWEFPNNSRLILNRKTSRSQVSISRKDKGPTEIARIKKMENKTQ